jgi:signal transduction histidine kinase
MFRPGRPGAPVDGSESKRVQHQPDIAQRFETIGEVACSVAHDFNNILSVILSYSEMVADAVTPEAMAAAGMGEPAHWDDVRADVTSIQVAVGRAAELTRELVRFARREGKQIGPLNLGTVVGGVSGMLRRSLGTRVQLATCVAPGTWPILMGAGPLEQVLLNLAVNARYAMPDGGTLAIDAQNVSGSRLGGDAVRLQVSDDGTGMTPETLSHAFEQFFTTKPDDVGTGLGLASVMRIINDAGGTIGIESELGRGTTITMTFPRCGGAAVSESSAVLALADVRHDESRNVLVPFHEAPIHW